MGLTDGLINSWKFVSIRGQIYSENNIYVHLYPFAVCFEISYTI